MSLDLFTYFLVFQNWISVFCVTEFMKVRRIADYFFPSFHSNMILIFFRHCSFFFLAWHKCNLKWSSLVTLSWCIERSRLKSSLSKSSKDDRCLWDDHGCQTFMSAKTDLNKYRGEKYILFGKIVFYLVQTSYK